MRRGQLIQRVNIHSTVSNMLILPEMPLNRKVEANRAIHDRRHGDNRLQKPHDRFLIPVMPLIDPPKAAGSEWTSMESGRITILSSIPIPIPDVTDADPAGMKLRSTNQCGHFESPASRQQECIPSSPKVGFLEFLIWGLPILFLLWLLSFMLFHA